MARKAQSYSCPFCTYTGEKQKNAQKHAQRHVKKIAEAAGYELVKIGEKVEPVIEPVNTNIPRAN